METDPRALGSFVFKLLERRIQTGAAQNGGNGLTNQSTILQHALAATTSLDCDRCSAKGASKTESALARCFREWQAGWRGRGHADREIARSSTTTDNAAIATNKPLVFDVTSY